MSTLMRNTDAFSWAMEHDPRLRSTVITVFVLDGVPDWAELTGRLRRAAATLPMFRQRVVANLPPAPPRWEDDPEFDLAFHLRRVVAPAPADLDAVLEMARRAEMDDFDRSRPLWEVTLVEGLEDGGAALLVKLHHALTDGVGGVEIAMILFDLQAEHVDRGPVPPPPRVVVPPPGEGLRQTARYDARQLREAARLAARAPLLLAQGLRRPLRSARAATELTGSIYRTVRPIGHTGSPLMQRRGRVRHLAVHEVSREALRAAGHVAGGTLNDAFLAGVAGGLRRYHHEHGSPVGTLHVNMPVNLRQEDDDLGGNRITLLRFDLPVDQADPLARIRTAHERAAGLRAEPSLPYTQEIAGALNLMPRWYIGSILRHVDVLASNVPGIPVHVYLGGAEVRMQYAFGPTIGAALNVTLMTYVDTCALGFNIDTAAVPDPDLLVRCLIEGLAEVTGLDAGASA